MFTSAALKKLEKLDKDDLLALIGLETKRTATDAILPTLGAFTVGVLVGAGLGLMLAPKAGTELRGELRNRLQGSDAMGRSSSSQATSPGARNESTPRPL